MAANSNENQGLKIAVACFVMLSVILAVTTYFGFKNYNEADAKLTAANSEVAAEKKAQMEIQRVINEFKEKIGLNKTEDAELVKAVTKQIDELTKKAAATAEAGNKAIAEYKAAGGAQAKVDELKQSLDAIVSGMNDPSKTLLSTSDRLYELLNSQALIAVSIGNEFHDVRKQLEDTNNVNAKKLDVEAAAAKAANADKESDHTKHETDRQALLSKVDALQTDTNKQAQEIAKLKNQIAQMDDDYRKKREDLTTQLKDFRDRLERKETVLDQKDGTVTFVDYGRGEVRTDIGRSSGAREQMVMTIFDKNAPGLPSDKPKGTIELIQVGPNSSLARIIETKNSIDPFRVGDQVYSAAWDRNRPQQFALIGKMDVNRDGRDDREDLKRMIQAAGGTVAYDLPPSGLGKETGKLTPLIAWYVVDDREAFHPSAIRESKAASGDDEQFYKKRTEAIKTARLDGIRPLSIERLLNMLGYSYTTPIPGRVQAIDRPAVESILNPRGRTGVLPPTTTTPPAATDAPAPDAEKPDAAEKKDEEKPEPEEKP